MAMKKSVYLGLLTLLLFTGILSACGASATATPTPDPYKTMSGRQVIEAYLKAYIAEDYAICRKMISPGNTALSENNLELNAKAARTKYGKITGYEMRGDDDSGAELFYRVLVLYEGQPKPGWIEAKDFKLRQSNGAWRLWQVPYF
jgi:hypothetical protein